MREGVSIQSLIRRRAAPIRPTDIVCTIGWAMLCTWRSCSSNCCVGACRLSLSQAMFSSCIRSMAARSLGVSIELQAKCSSDVRSPEMYCSKRDLAMTRAFSWSSSDRCSSASCTIAATRAASQYVAGMSKW